MDLAPVFWILVRGSSEDSLTVAHELNRGFVIPVKTRDATEGDVLEVILGGKRLLTSDF